MKKAQKKWKLARDWKGDLQMRREASLRGISFGRHPKVSSPIVARCGPSTRLSNGRLTPANPKKD